MLPLLCPRPERLKVNLLLGRERGDRGGEVSGLEHDAVPEGGVVKAFLDAEEAREDRCGRVRSAVTKQPGGA